MKLSIVIWFIFIYFIDNKIFKIKERFCELNFIVEKNEM